MRALARGWSPRETTLPFEGETMPHRLSGNPAVVGQAPFRPEILRPRLSTGLPFLQKPTRATRTLTRTSMRYTCNRRNAARRHFATAHPPKVSAPSQLYSPHDHPRVRLARGRHHHG